MKGRAEGMKTVLPRMSVLTSAIHTLTSPAAVGKAALVMLCCWSLICGRLPGSDEKEPSSPASVSRPAAVLPVSPQRSGDAQAGRDYLIHGNYLTSGVPLEAAKRLFSEVPNHLRRTGESAGIPYRFNLVTSKEGQAIVVSNCLSCHAQVVDGQFVMGLGNSFVDLTTDLGAKAAAIDLYLAGQYGLHSPQREAYQPFKTALTAVAPFIRTKVRGVNSANKLAFVLTAYRDAQTLEWHMPEEIPRSLRTEPIPTDVPAWWLLKKKHAMFYSGIGRGDFARVMMASSLVTLKDATEAAEIDRHFVDVLAFLRTITPPRYPKRIDSDLAARGRVLFEEHCARCHGSYGASERYPNLLISVDEVDTDPLLAEANWEKNRSYFEAYNKSWFGRPPHGARLVPTRGYVAPPLDGIWITAPYLHNGSVPDLMSLLESSRRPVVWRRSFRADDYDYEKVGWRYEQPELDQDHDTMTYDTRRTGYGNGGHRYGDLFNTEERRAVIEYLKTL